MIGRWKKKTKKTRESDGLETEEPKQSPESEKGATCTKENRLLRVNQVKAGNRVNALTLNPSVHVL